MRNGCVLNESRNRSINYALKRSSWESTKLVLEVGSVAVGVVDSEGSASDFVAVQRPHGILGRVGILELAEAETLRTAGLSVVNNPA